MGCNHQPAVSPQLGTACEDPIPRQPRLDSEQSLFSDGANDIPSLETGARKFTLGGDDIGDQLMMLGWMKCLSVGWRFLLTLAGEYG